MTFKEALENNPFVALSVTAIAAASMGWAGHVTLLAQTKQDVVLQGTYVLKEEIDSGSSKLYVQRALLTKASADHSDADARLARALADVNVTKSTLPKQSTSDDNTVTSLRECRTRSRELEQKLDAAKTTTCPETILDNFYVSTATGKFNVSQCIADGTTAAGKLGGTVSRKDNALRITGALGSSDGYYCAVACSDEVTVVSCNSLSTLRSTGLTTQLLNWMGIR